MKRSEDIEGFIQRWSKASGSELANAQTFVIELCELLGLERPAPSLQEASENGYAFERHITFRHPDGSTSPGRIDCYRRGCFVLESKKVKAGAATKGFDDALLRAHAQAQAQNYARGRWRERLPTILETLHAVGRAQPQAGGRWQAV